MKIAKELVAMAKELTAIRMVHKREFYRPNPKYMDNIEEIDVPEDVDLEVWKYEKKGSLFGVAFAGRAQKPVWHYRFRSEGQLQKKIDDSIKTRRSIAQNRKERAEQRKIPHSLKKGDILSSSWGYDQTNIDFYEVVDVLAKSVVVRKIGEKVVKSSPGSDYVVPAPGKFIGPAMRKRATKDNYVRIDSVSSASPWNGKPLYQTAIGWGH